MESINAEIKDPPKFSYNAPFNLKLVQVAPNEDEASGKTISSLFIGFDAIQKMSRVERVLVWNLPLVALQRKTGGAGQFCLPDKIVIDDVFAFTLNDYREAAPTSYRVESIAKGFSSLTIHWIKSAKAARASNKKDKDVSAEASAENEKSGDSRIAPMKERDWDYVFQANKILHCSFVNTEDNTMSRAPHAAFRLRDSGEQDAEAHLPQDDEKAMIPVWSLPQRPSHTYLVQTTSELETSAITSGHSKKSWEVGLSGAYKIVSGGAKFGRSTENSSKDSSTYGSKQKTMMIIHEIPIIELSLDQWNCRISDACRQALLKLRAERSFDDLMGFFQKYGTIYARQAVLGGRLIKSLRINEEKKEEIQEMEKGLRKHASASLGIDPFSIEGSFSSESSMKNEQTTKEEESDKRVHWTGYGGNPALVSTPEKWLSTVGEYKYWKVVGNLDVESIQDFIGHLPGYSDIPSLFQDILSGGLYSPEIIHLGPRPALKGQESHSDDKLQSVAMGTGIDMLSGNPNSSAPLIQIPQDRVTSRTVATGGTFWQLFDSRDAVEMEVSTAFQSLANISANRLSIPTHLYKLQDNPPHSLSFQLTSIAQEHLKDKNPEQFYAAFGQQFLESYTEKCTMSALWKISLLTNDKDVNAEESFYTLRLRLQKYFLSPRTVPEVCEFFSNTTGHDMRTSVTIIGYRDEFTNELKTLNHEASGTAQEYLTREALARSKTRTSLTVRPWKNLVFDWDKVELNDSLKKELQKGAEEKVSVTVPEEFFVLKTQKAAQLLLLLQLHHSPERSDVELINLSSYGRKLDVLLKRESLDDNGLMKSTAGVKEELVKLVKDLEGDLAKVKSRQATADKS